MTIVCVVGCSDFPAPEYETERVQIALTFEGKLCAGTAATIEHWAASTSTLLAIDPLIDDPVLLVWGDDAVSDYCNEGADGCYLHSSRVIAARYPAIEHELTHATTQQSGGARRNALIEEGIAEGMTAGTLSRGDADPRPSALIGLTEAEFEALGARNVSGHFFRYLSETYGFKVLGELRLEVEGPVSRDEADAAFINTLGVSLAEAEQAWLADAPSTYTRLPSTTPAADAVLTDSVTFSFQLSCDSPATEGPLIGVSSSVADPTPGMRSARTLDVPVPHIVQIVATGTPSSGRGLVFRSVACWDGSTRNEIHEVPLGETNVVELGACRWEVALWTADYSSLESEVTIAAM